MEIRSSNDETQTRRSCSEVMEFSDGSMFSFHYFFPLQFFWEFIFWIWFIFFPRSTEHKRISVTFITNSRPYPQTHVLIQIGWALWWTDSINKMRCFQFCITKSTSLFRKIHHLFRVSKGLKKQSCLRVHICVASCLICNGWRYTCALFLASDVWSEYDI